MDKHLDKLTREMRATNQRLAGLQHQAQQPHLVTQADVETGKKTNKRTEGAAADVDKYGDTSCARAEENPTSLTSFGKITEPLPAPEKSIGDALVNAGAETPKPHLP